MAKSFLRVYKSGSRSLLDTKKKNPNNQFSYAPIQAKTDVNKTDVNKSENQDLSGYKQPQSRDIIDNVMRSHNGTGQIQRVPDIQASGDFELDLLGQAMTFSSFEKFSKTEFSEENVQAYKDIQKWKAISVTNSEAKEGWYKSIYRKYIESDLLNLQGQKMQNEMRIMVTYGEYDHDLMKDHMNELEQRVKKNMSDTLSRAKMDKNSSGRKKRSNAIKL
jgi:hypothetical protein